jgi:site-specific DNA recombinase
MTPALSCAIYCRFSSKQQEGGFSIEAQKSACLDFAAKQGWKIYRIFEDRAISGTSDERDAFQEMIQLAFSKTPPFSVILVHKLDRFARNRYDSIKYKHFLRKRGIRVASATQPIIGSNDPTEVLLESMLEGMDEFYSLNLARESIKGMAEAAKSGYWCHGKAPFGYRKKYFEINGRRRPKLEVDPKEAEIIEYIYNRYASREVGISTLTQELNQKGWRTRTGHHFAKNMVEFILGSEKYVGDMKFGKEINTGNRPIKALQDPIIVKNSHPPIISRELAEKVRSIMDEKNPDNTPPRTFNNDYLFSGLIVCGKCGAHYIGASAKGGKYHYYMCGRKSRSGRAACDVQDLSREQFEQKVIGKLRKRIFTRENIKSLAYNLYELSKTAGLGIPEKIRTLDRDITMKKNKLKKIYEVIENSENLNQDDLAPRIRELKTEIQQNEIQKEQYAKEMELIQKSKFNHDWVEQYAQLLISLLESNDFLTRKNFLRRVIQDIEVCADGCRIRYNPFQNPSTLPSELAAEQKKPRTQGKNPEFSVNEDWLPLLVETENRYLMLARPYIFTFCLKEENLTRKH